MSIFGDTLEKEEEFEALCEWIFQATKSGRLLTEDAVEQFDHFVKYYLLINKKNNPSCAGDRAIASSNGSFSEPILPPKQKKSI